MTITADGLYAQAEQAFKNHVEEGITLFKSNIDQEITPRTSHVCFKFTSQEAYQAFIEASYPLGAVSAEQFNNKEISWCKLDKPLQSGDITADWLEMVQPKFEANPFDGVTSIGYFVASLKEVVKLQSSNENILFRFQSIQAHP